MSAHPERFHALDATRAFALLLGIVFHAAWFYVPFPVKTPVSDVGGNDFFGWFFVWSHTFRMQLFFLIAGFFARLVVEKRGVKAFVKNRIGRILVPLVLCWFLLIPVFYMVWIWGAGQSGQGNPEVPPIGVGLYLLISGRVFVEAASGGAFTLIHLWFLYYLALMYVIVLGVRALLIRKGGTRGEGRVDRVVGFLARSVWGPVLLAGFFWPGLVMMESFIGVTTPTNSLAPVWSTLAVYLGFFVFGWLLHRQSARLGDFFRSWRIHLAVGLALSIPLYAVTEELLTKRGSGKDSPILEFTNVVDWEIFRTSLADLEGGASVRGGRLWGKLPEWLRENVSAGRELSEDERVGVLKEIGRLLVQEDLFTADPPTETAAGLPPMVKPSPEVVLANREEFDGLVEGIVLTRVREQGWFWPVKIGFSYVYSLVMCCLVFGCMGFFQAFCAQHSPGWRYVADSSYWLYVVHIPLVPFLEILIFNWELAVWVKFPLLLLVSFVLLFASYHFFVRSTPVGRLLNGRSYPFHWNPLRSVAEQNESGR